MELDPRETIRICKKGRDGGVADFHGCLDHLNVDRMVAYAERVLELEAQAALLAKAMEAHRHIDASLKIWEHEADAQSEYVCSEEHEALARAYANLRTHTRAVLDMEAEQKGAKP